MTATPELYLGMISGTSMDGIDAALVNFSGQQPDLIAASTTPYSATLKEAVAGACQGQPLNAGDLAELDARVGQAFAEAALDLLAGQALESTRIKALGSHGQNVFHGPDCSPPVTLQLGNPHVIAHRSGIATVADFRRRDVALGGQGAPLAPALHQQIFASLEESRAVLNVGGIANLTLLPAQTGAVTLGFDTGPGNCLMDEWIAQHRGQAFDNQGDWAASGTAQPTLVERWLRDPYFSRPAPKSTGREYFDLNWLGSTDALREAAPEDVQASLLELTARTVSSQLLERLPGCRRLLVCGGGARNQRLLNRLSELLESVTVEPTDCYGVPADSVEAVLFASLARSAVNQETINLSSVTGAPPHVYGVLYPA